MLIYRLIFHSAYPIVPITAKPSNTPERRLRVKVQGKVKKEEDGWWLRPRKKRNNRAEGRVKAR
jgi:hypothetical protein